MTENGLTAGTGCRTITVVFARVWVSPSIVSSYNTIKIQFHRPQNKATFCSPRKRGRNGQTCRARNRLPCQCARISRWWGRERQQIDGKTRQSSQKQMSELESRGQWYSQGGQLVHNATKMLKASTAAGGQLRYDRFSRVLLSFWGDTGLWLSSAIQTTVRLSQASLLQRRRLFAILETVFASMVIRFWNIILPCGLLSYGGHFFD